MCCATASAITVLRRRRHPFAVAGAYSLASLPNHLWMSSGEIASR